MCSDLGRVRMAADRVDQAVSRFAIVDELIAPKKTS
jgi:hypothetical protein